MFQTTSASFLTSDISNVVQQVLLALRTAAKSLNVNGSIKTWPAEHSEAEVRILCQFLKENDAFERYQKR